MDMLANTFIMEDSAIEPNRVAMTVASPAGLNFVTGSENEYCPGTSMKHNVKNKTKVAKIPRKRRKSAVPFNLSSFE